MEVCVNCKRLNERKERNKKMGKKASASNVNCCWFYLFLLSAVLFYMICCASFLISVSMLLFSFSFSFCVLLLWCHMYVWVLYSSFCDHTFFNSINKHVSLNSISLKTFPLRAIHMYRDQLDGSLSVAYTHAYARTCIRHSSHASLSKTQSVRMHLLQFQCARKRGINVKFALVCILAIITNQIRV